TISRSETYLVVFLLVEARTRRDGGLFSLIVVPTLRSLIQDGDRQRRAYGMRDVSGSDDIGTVEAAVSCMYRRELRRACAG
ncbi:hypothetical protein, partial [Burkholderia oklahomensis]|uniref:hypothetical protein n=1 Tax=Burkholderia oklahomensis TaxID=342113 RepID=UPI001E29A5C5